jgi:hypothetical protein
MRSPEGGSWAELRGCLGAAQNAGRSKAPLRDAAPNRLRHGGALGCLARLPAADQPGQAAASAVPPRLTVTGVQHAADSSVLRSAHRMPRRVRSPADLLDRPRRNRVPDCARRVHRLPHWPWRRAPHALTNYAPAESHDFPPGFTVRTDMTRPAQQWCTARLRPARSGLRGRRVARVPRKRRDLHRHPRVKRERSQNLLHLGRVPGSPEA